LSCEARDSLEQAAEELPPDDRRELNRALAVFAQSIQAGHDDVVDRVRHADLRQTFHQSIAAVVTLDDPEVKQRLRDLFNEERHTLRLVHQGRPQLGGKLVGTEHATGHRRGLGLAQTPEREVALERDVPLE
jgi:hypothetical protein